MAELTPVQYDKGTAIAALPTEARVHLADPAALRRNLSSLLGQPTTP